MSCILNLEITDQALLEATEVGQVLKHWDEHWEEEGFIPTSYLTRLSEIIEEETEQYTKLDPDPFDDRHPGRIHPTCALGLSLKALFKKETFMSKLVHEYMRETWGDNDLSVNTAACRLFIGILPGLESSVVYQDTEGLIMRLFTWAETAPEPLRSYAVGLLGASMEIPDVASKFKEKNQHLVPIMLKRLWNFHAEMTEDFERPFVQFAKNNGNMSMSTPEKLSSAAEKVDKLGHRTSSFSTPERTHSVHHTLPSTPLPHRAVATPDNKMSVVDGVIATPDKTGCNGDSGFSTPGSNKRKRTNATIQSLEGRKRIRVDLEDDGRPAARLNSHHDGYDPLEDLIPFGSPMPVNIPGPSINECSSSSWAEMESNIIGTMKIYPLTVAGKQILTLRYLCPLGEYQEMLLSAFENKAVKLIINYMDPAKTKDSRLTFEALKYLSSLLCHKKIALEFINAGGLPKMLQIPRPSISSTAVALCLYYLAYAEDAMEKICLMPKTLLTNLVGYAMWLLECSHQSSRNNAIMFFGVTYPFKIMLDLFDSQDGLRLVLNSISTLPNFLPGDNETSEEEQAIARQVIRQVSYNLKRYFECHLGFLAEKLRRMQQVRERDLQPVVGVPYYKPLTLDAEKLRELNNTVLELMPLWARWHPVEKLIKLGGLHNLMQICALAFDWNFAGRAETIKSVLEVLAICALVPRVQYLLTERYTVKGNSNLAYGLSVILSAADGDIITDPEVQRAALFVIGNCVCGPLNRPGASLDLFQHPTAVPKTPLRKLNIKSSEDLLHKMWECVRVNNGILILTRLLSIKTPITDADSIRSLACWCLSGLARYKPVCNVLEQLPLMKTGQIQLYVKEPVLQEKRHEHVLFQKSALEIFRLVYGGRMIGVEYDLSVVAIHKSDLISQTRIQYNEKQLLELVHEYLTGKGLSETASVLAKEGKLEHVVPPAISSTSHGHSSIVNGLPLTPARPGKSSYGFKAAPPVREVTLETIVKEYLINQHSLCKAPMATCPTFDLLVPHKCPTPKSRPTTGNFAARFGLTTGYDWCGNRSANRKLIYSRFKPIRVLRPAEDDQFTTAAFSPCNQWTIVGTHQGEVKLFNIGTGNEDGTYNCHDSEIYNLQPNSKGTLLLTSSVWRRPLSCLWRMESLFDKVLEFEREEYIEFSKLTQDKVIATNMDHCYVYDIETKEKIFSGEPRMSNQYVKNRATFDPTDELILSDGVLWDFRSGKEIHKFDKLNDNISGVFHPNGLEIIANTEVWDVRTFKLLKTVRDLDQCMLEFTHDGTVIYGVRSEREAEDGYRSSDTSFITMDATDYERIATIELKRSIQCLVSSPNDLQIALVENHTSGDDSVTDSCVRFYEVGRSRDQEDETVEEDEEEEDGAPDSDDDDSDEDLDVDRLLDELLPDDVGEAYGSSQEEDSQEESDADGEAAAESEDSSSGDSEDSSQNDSDAFDDPISNEEDE